MGRAPPPEPKPRDGTAIIPPGTRNATAAEVRELLAERPSARTAARAPAGGTGRERFCRQVATPEAVAPARRL